jgi:hypothetical protein
MENLYESAIVKLQSRVSSLETRSQTKTPPSNNQQHGGGHGSTNQQIKSTPIETNAQNSHEIAYTTRNESFVGSTRGVPQVGRVIPPSKQNLFSMNR